MSNNTVVDTTVAQAVAAKHGRDLRLLIAGDPEEGSTDLWVIDLDSDHGEVQVEDDEGTWRVNVDVLADGVFPTSQSARDFAALMVEASDICDEINAAAVQS